MPNFNPSFSDAEIEALLAQHGLDVPRTFSVRASVITASNSCWVFRT
jgi:hypothetical protein